MPGGGRLILNTTGFCACDRYQQPVAVLQASLEQDVPVTAITGMAMLSQIAEQEAARRHEGDDAML